MGAKDRLEVLKKLQKARSDRSNKSVLDDQFDDDVYDLVDEDQYRKVKRQELLKDDFVDDDDGQGYVDRGIDTWEDDHRYYDGEDEDNENKLERNNASNSKKRTHKAKDTIGDMVKQQKVKNILQHSENKPKNVSLDDFKDILDEFDSSPSVKKPKLVKKYDDEPMKRPQYNIKEIDSSPLKNRQSSNACSIITQPVSYGDSSDEQEIEKILNDIKSSPNKTKEEINAADSSDDEEIQFSKRKAKSVAIHKRVNLHSSTVPLSSSPLTFVTAPNTPASKQVPSSSYPSEITSKRFTSKLSQEQVVDPTSGKFQLYWLDFTELDTSLLLFGILKTRNGQFISAMVEVVGLARELYFLPKKDMTSKDVHSEIIPLLLEKYGLDSIRAKPETKKYSFELPNIPPESEYLKVLLPFDTPKSKNVAIPAELEGDTFYHVFGGNTGLFETFVTQRKIMGPCWLEISGGDFDSLQGASHCSVEVKVSSPSHIEPIDEKSSPNLNCVSLALQTVMNTKENKQEIVSITLSIYKNIQQDTAISDQLKPTEIVTLVRPPQSSSFPPLLAPKSKKELPGTVRLFNNEKTLLNCFCALLKVNDPDVIVGHKLENVILDILSHRAYELKIPQFSVFGRRSRKQWPDRFGKSGNTTMSQFMIRELFSGRLLCDISNEMGQSLTPKCQNWELNEMYQVACGRERKSLEINFSNPIYQEDESQMLLALRENIENSIVTAEVAFSTQILSLTKQLTTLAGNAWSQTLGGTRAGRNEYILLHEFTRNGYIVPDKESRHLKQERLQKQKDPTISQPSGKKAKYQGGLVFEPEKGLHKDYTLVMDFNSLYPSIIQEFNICFTTVSRDPNDIDQLPEVPRKDMMQGVLPRLLANLVDRRREVKNLMKNETNQSKKAQYDIRQQALKLTANSMYGCLGYVNSRFYAKPLAMLVTNKGREILMNTRQLAESLGLVVVYGDTDSVMINTGSSNYADAIKIGENFKKMVNERYRLLEIDIDNVFKRLLLHAKKKYAALNVSFDKQGKEQTTLEVKGLDMKRREFCPLSKEVSTHVLNVILSDKDPESALQEIYDYMEKIRSMVENNEVRMDKFKINTKLSKDPSLYPGGKTMPAVQVALRMREAGRVVKAGSVITFVITKSDNEKDEDEGQTSVAQRARALNEVMRQNNNLKPDPVYYLEKQIFSPVERLLERIECFDIVRLSQSLGLDSRKYLNRSGTNGELGPNGIEGLQPLESTISDEERFRDSVPLEFVCPNCQHKFKYGGIVASNNYRITFLGLQCSHCEHQFTPIQMTSQLERTIRAHISLYYAGWLSCDDTTCGTVTRQISVFGKRCLAEDCTGVMRYKYTDKQLYNQLLYLKSLFDIQKNKSGTLKPLYTPEDPDIPSRKLTSSEVHALTDQNKEIFDLSRQIVEKYLSDCGRAYVDMGNIFDFMQPTS